MSKQRLPIPPCPCFVVVLPFGY